jgi:hypothetical protein
MAAAAPAVNIEFGYDLPFAVRVQAVPAGTPVRLVVETREAATEENFRQIEAHVQVWIENAMFGAGGGPGLKPVVFGGALDVTQVLAVHDANPTPNAITFEGPAIVCESTYATVLLGKLLCLAHHFVPLKNVHLTLPTPTSVARPIAVSRGPASQLPERAVLAFPWDEDIDTGADSVALTIRFVRPLPRAELERLTKVLWSWLAQGIQGGYLSPPYDPETFALLASEDPTVAGDEVEWVLSDVEVDLRGFNVLANILQAFSDRFAQVAGVTLE